MIVRCAALCPQSLWRCTDVVLTEAMLPHSCTSVKYLTESSAAWVVLTLLATCLALLPLTAGMSSLRPLWSHV